MVGRVRSPIALTIEEGGKFRPLRIPFRECEQGMGLALQSPDADPYIIEPDVSIHAQAGSARYVRLRASVSYSATAGTTDAGPLLLQWFWHGRGSDWSEEQSRTMPVKGDGKGHVYWMVLPTEELREDKDVEQAISGLRCDPANGAVPAQVRWIALDLVR